MTSKQIQTTIAPTPDDPFAERYSLDVTDHAIDALNSTAMNKMREAQLHMQQEIAKAIKWMQGNDVDLNATGVVKAQLGNHSHEIVFDYILHSVYKYVFEAVYPFSGDRGILCLSDKRTETAVYYISKAIKWMQEHEVDLKVLLDTNNQYMPANQELRKLRALCIKQPGILYVTYGPEPI